MSETIMNRWKIHNLTFRYKVNGVLQNLNGKRLQLIIWNKAFKNWEWDWTWATIFKQVDIGTDVTENIFTISWAESATLTDDIYRWRVKILTMSWPTVINEDWTNIYTIKAEE